jgi:hypothetical protein
VAADKEHMNSTRRYDITLTDFTIAFVPFAILLGAALLAAEATFDFGFNRTVYTIWATTALITPALCAFALPGDSSRRHSLWLLFWTFSFLVYLVHIGYAVFTVYHGSGREIIAGQGIPGVIVNILFTIWWAMDLILAWFSSSDARWLRIERAAVHVFIGITLFTSTIILKHGFITLLGSVMTASVLICLLVRFDAMRRACVEKEKALAP